MGMTDKASLVVKLEGNSSIDANTLINMLTHYVTISERTNELVGDGVYKSDIKVKALKEGSFEISFEVVTTWLGDLFKGKDVSHAAAVVTCVRGVLELFKILKGKKATKEEAKTIINNHYEVKAETIVSVYNDPITREAVRRSFDTAKNDENVKGVTIIANGKKSPTITEEEFGDLVIPPDDPMPEDKVITNENAILSIVSLSFSKGDDWRFVYEGNTIKTKLADGGLQDAIDRGMAFAKGDALAVRLEIKQKWDGGYNTYVNKSYKVIEVIKHIPRPTQERFDFERDNDKQQ